MIVGRDGYPLPQLPCVTCKIDAVKVAGEWVHVDDEVYAFGPRRGQSANYGHEAVVDFLDIPAQEP